MLLICSTFTQLPHWWSCTLTRAASASALLSASTCRPLTVNIGHVLHGHDAWNIWLYSQDFRYSLELRSGRWVCPWQLSIDTQPVFPWLETFFVWETILWVPQDLLSNPYVFMPNQLPEVQSHRSSMVTCSAVSASASASQLSFGRPQWHVSPVT